MTQVIVEERGVTPGQDFSAGGYRSIHPIFILTFYPGHRGVRIEAVSEIAWLNRLQTVQYSATLWTGAPGSEVADYELKDFSHVPKTRWRRDTWSGRPVGKINIDHNLAYMVYSRILPSFDLSRSVGGSAIDDTLKYYKDRDNFPKLGPDNCSKPGGTCMWYSDFGSSGGRPELGVLPSWDVRYLYTFDPRLYDVMIANANVSGHVPIHVRESSAGKAFHSGAATPAEANSRVVSIDARSCYVSRFVGEISCEEDKPVFLTKPSTGIWDPDLAHQGSFAFVAYLVTGDWYYLEELYFWASWNVAWANQGNCNYCRGGNDDNPGIYGVVNPWQNIRGIAWGLRAVAQAAILAPDESPEKGYFTEKVLNNIAAAEGRFSIRGGLASQSPEREGVWQYGFRDLGAGLVNPLYSWWPSVTKNNISPYSNLNPDTCANWTTSYMQNFNYIMFGYVEELGFPAQVLRGTMLRGILNQIANPEYNPYLIDEIDICNGPAVNEYFQDWKGVLSGFRPAVQQRKSFQSQMVGDVEHGYGYIALAAASYLAGVGDGNLVGLDAYQWLADNYPGQSALNGNPKWALVPRLAAVKGSISSPATWSKSVKTASKSTFKGKAVSARAR